MLLAIAAYLSFWSQRGMVLIACLLQGAVARLITALLLCFLAGSYVENAPGKDADQSKIAYDLKSITAYDVQALQVCIVDYPVWKEVFQA